MDTILAYAELTDDFNPLHVDPVFAATTTMGEVIAHGTMSLGLILMAACEQALKPGVVLELDVRFIAPVRVGESLMPVLNTGPNQTTSQVSVLAKDGQVRIAGVIEMTPPTSP